MKSIKMYFVPILILFLAVSPSLYAQKDLQINKVFEQYGEMKGVTMVDMTNEMLFGYDFSLFKSITIK